MKASALLFLIISGITIVASAKPEAYQVFRPNGSVIDFYITKPNSNKFAVTLVVQGSGCDSAYADDRRTFTVGNNEETARLDVEKYGVDRSSTGCPSEFLRHNRISQRISDHLQVLSYIRNQPWWDGRLFILGGSEGGIVAGALASLIPETKAVGLMSSPLGETMAESWLKLRERDLRKQGLSNEDVTNSLQKIKVKFQEIRNNPTSDLSYEGVANTYFWWADILDFGTYNLLLETNVPIIFFQGDQDLMSDVSSARRLVDRFKQAGKLNLSYREMPGMGHTFVDQDGKSHLGEVLAEMLKFFGK